MTYQDKLSGVVIEFHDVDINKKIISKFIANFDLILTHIHPNNFEEVDEFGDPLVIEMTFEKNPEINNKKFLLPNEFDQPNNPNNKDITLKFEQ